MFLINVLILTKNAILPKCLSVINLGLIVVANSYCSKYKILDGHMVIQAKSINIYLTSIAIILEIKSAHIYAL